MEFRNVGHGAHKTMAPLMKLKSSGSSPTQHDKLAQQAQKWVAMTFYGTLMKQMRNSPFRSKLLDGGRGGEAFGAMYDQRLAEHMTRGPGRKLADAIVRKIEARQAYARSAKAKPAAAAAPRGRSPGGAQEHTHVPTTLRA